MSANGSRSVTSTPPAVTHVPFVHSHLQPTRWAPVCITVKELRAPLEEQPTWVSVFIPRKNTCLSRELGMGSLSHFISFHIYERRLVYKAPFRHRERNVMTFRGPVSKDFIFLAREVDSTTER